MSSKKKQLFYFATFKPRDFTVKFPKFLRELRYSSQSKPFLSNADIRRIRTCKVLRSLQTSFSDSRKKKMLYEFLCRLRQKTIHYLNTSGILYSHIIRSPRRYDLQLGNIRSWKHFFQKRSVRYLKMYFNQYDTELTEKKNALVLYHLQHSIKALTYIRDVEISGHVLTDFAETLVDHTTLAIQKLRKNMNIDIKTWDHNSENLYWIETPIIKQYTSSIYFVTRCTNSDNLIEPMDTLPSFKNLQKLEFWLRLHQKNDFSILKRLEDCTQLSELRIRFDFDGDLEKVTKKFLTNIKLPESLTFLNLGITGLRLNWIGDMPRIKDIEEDKSAIEFFEELKKLQSLKTFQIAFHDLRIKYSSILINTIRCLENIRELSVVMGLREFEFKDAHLYPILDLGFWCKKLSKIFSQLSTLSMDFPCIFLEQIDSSMQVLRNVQTLSLGYRISSKEKGCPKLNELLGMLDTKKISGIFLGDSNTHNEDEFRKRFEILSQMGVLQNLTIAVTVPKISNQLLDYFCGCIGKMKQLQRVACRLEKAVIEEQDWRLRIMKTFARLKYLTWGNIRCKNGNLEFER